MGSPTIFPWSQMGSALFFFAVYSDLENKSLIDIPWRIIESTNLFLWT